MNFIDLVLILLFFGMLSTGFFQGMIKLLVLIFAFYLSLVLASLYYPAVGNFLVVQFDTERFVGQYIGFTLVMFLAMVLLSIAGFYTFRYAQLPGQLQYLDRIVGTLLGMIMGALLVGIFAVLLWNLMIVRGGQTIDFPIMRSLGRSVATSQILSFFANSILPQTYSLVDPFLPDGAALIFAIQ
ncbi:MAG: CvpA family protein [Oscillochloris sp.]|nr:CvpA family protein [Oscillochloris sp.]